MDGKIERMWSLDEAADILGVCKRGVYRLIAKRLLPQPVKVGNCSKIPESELAAYQERIKRERRQ